MEDLTPEQQTIERELTSADTFVRALQDISKRLDAANFAAKLTPAQQERYNKLQDKISSLFE